eukprot:2714776-Ditylum_brightwellii.AAC.2
MAAVDTQFCQPFKPSLPIEDFFEQFNEVQDLCAASGAPYSDAQLNNIAYDLIFRTAVHNDGCKEWIWRPLADKTWATFRPHFMEQH